MTREHAKKMLPIITAFANGERVQWYFGNGKWKDLINSAFDDDPTAYRIVPKSEDAEWLRNQVKTSPCFDEKVLERALAIADKLERLEAGQ